MEKKRRFYFYYAAMCLLLFLTQFANTTQGVLLTDHIEHYGLASTTQGLISTAQSAGASLAVLALIFLSGRIRNHVLLGIGAGLIVVSMALLGSAPPFALLLLLYLCFGMGFGSISSISSAQSSLMFPGNAFAMGLMHAFFGVGGLLGPVVFSNLRHTAGLPWNAVCLVAAAVALVLFAFYASAAWRTREALSSLGSRQQVVRFSDILTFFKRKRNLLLMLSILGYAAFQNGYNIWIVRYFSNGLGAVAIAAGSLSLFWVSNTVARFVIPKLPLRAETTVALGCLLAAACTALGVLCGNATLMLVCACLAGFFSGPAIPQFYHLSCSWNPERPLMASSFTSIMMYLSWTITAPLTAALNGGGRWTGGMLLVALYALIGGLALLPVMLRGKRGEPTA